MNARRAPGTDQWNAAVACGLIRLGAGAALLRWPAQLARLAGARDDDTLIRTVFRGFGARDLMLGVESLTATRPGRDARRSLRTQAVADVVDGAIIAAAIATGRLPRRQGIGAVSFAVVSALSLFVAAQQLGDPA